ncbi:MAG: KH domain-containing protein, partial [Armatimonadetes bacterium]|nr:KH domain-containing protein [Armatimonadota bacterium]
AVAVEIEDFARREDKDGRYLTYIRATIHVERAGQKGILIGKEGRMLREVGRLSRQEIERLVGEKVYLDLWVKVTPGWREKDALVRGFYPQ